LKTQNKTTTKTEAKIKQKQKQNKTKQNKTNDHRLADCSAFYPPFDSFLI